MSVHTANGGVNGGSPYSQGSTAGMTSLRQYRAIPFNDVEANAKANGRIMFDVERCVWHGAQAYR
jgi:hypothetical protein